MELKEAVDRARSQIGIGTKYRLGGGKTRPNGSNCQDEDKGCDCSAFVCWVLRLPKWQRNEIWYLSELNDGWLNTDGMWLDAKRSFGFFHQIAYPLPGSIIVFPSHKGVMGLPEQPGPKVGHVGIVTNVTRHQNARAGRHGTLESLAYFPTIPTQVVHCSSGNFRGWGDAIVETDATVWNRRRSTIYAWPSSIRPDVPGLLRMNGEDGG